MARRHDPRKAVKARPNPLDAAGITFITLRRRSRHAQTMRTVWQARRGGRLGKRRQGEGA